jgi:hypothetical protein
VIRVEHDLVHASLGPVNTPLAGKVRVMSELYSRSRGGVDQDQIAVLDLTVVLDVVEHDGVRTGGHDRGIAVGRRPAFPPDELHRRLDLILVQAGSSESHRLAMTLGAQDCRPRAGCRSRRDFDQPQFRQHRPDIVNGERRRRPYRSWWERAVWSSEVMRRRGWVAEPVEEGVAAQHQAGKDRVEFGEFVAASAPNRSRGPLDPGPVSRPDLHLAVAGPHEQVEVPVGVAGDEHAHRVRLVESGEVVEVGVLAEHMVDVVVANSLGGGGHTAMRARRRSTRERERWSLKRSDMVLPCDASVTDQPALPVGR